MPTTDPDPDALRWDDARHLCYLEALSENLRRLPEAAEEDQSILWGDTAIYLSMIGEDVRSRSVIASLRSQGPSSTAPDVSHVGGRDAVAAIVERAGAHSVVILNEAHHVSRHRDLVRRLLPGLKAAGYTHLAAEALSHDLPPDAASGSPTARFGSYVRDPAFARLLFEARQLGFIIVPYEAPPADGGPDRIAAMQAREFTQARRLYDRTLARDPALKLVVLVGYDHVEEVPRQRSDGQGVFLWMAAELSRLAGIDPLTIDQTTLNPEAALWAEAPEYRPLLGSFSPATSVVLWSFGEPAVLGRFRNRVDLQVLHPPAPLIRGREAWRWTGMTAIEPALPVSAAPDQLFLAQAFLVGETGSVPVDQTLVSTGDLRPLLVPPGTDVEVRILPVGEKLAEWLRTPAD